MKYLRREISIFLTLLFLTSCARMELTPQDPPLVGNPPLSITAPAPEKPESTTAAPQGSETPGTYGGTEPTKSKPTQTHTLTLTPPHTLAISLTQVFSPTAIAPAVPEIITRTEWITTAWSFRDLTIIEGAQIYQAAWKQDGSLLAVGTGVGIFVFDTLTLERVQAFNIGEAVYTTVFSPGEGLLALGLLNGDIQWREPETGEFVTTFDAHLLGVRDMVFPVGNQYLVSGSDDGSVILWMPSQPLASTAVEHVPVDEWRTADRVTSVDIHPVRQLIAAGSFQSVSVWNITSREQVKTLTDMAGWVKELAFRPSGNALAIVDTSNTIQLWDSTTWFLTHLVKLVELDQLQSLAFSSDGRMLALGGRNGRVVMWDLETNRISDLVHGFPHPVTDLSFNPTSDTLAVCYLNGTLRLWSKPPSDP